MQKNRKSNRSSARPESGALATKAAEIAAYDWNVDYLKECEERTRHLRDKAYFLGLNKLATLLESVRTESQTVLRTLVVANVANDDTPH